MALALVGLVLGAAPVRAADTGLAENGGHVDNKTKEPAESIFSADEIQFDIAAQDLADALILFGEQADLSVMVHQDVIGIETGGLRGEFTVADGLERLLAKTGLEYRTKGEAVIVSRPVAQLTRADEPERKPLLRRVGAALAAGLLAAAGTGAAAEDDDGRTEAEDEPDKVVEEIIIVTGTRMGLPPSQLSSTVISMDREALLDSGASTLQEALADLPQNIGGGSAVGGGSRTWFGNNDQFNGTDNVFGASTINLRGVGNRHTLILVDGMRLGSSGLIGGYTDVSHIPLEMVERVEIQLDGSSAVYGADAIGGVVNIILRKDYEATVANLRFTGSTRKGTSEKYNGSLASTFAWDSENITGTMTWYRRTDQSLAQTPGLKEFLYGEGTYTDRGIVVGIDSLYSRDSWVELEGLSAMAGRPVTYADIPEGQDGTNLSLSDFATADELSRSEEIGPGSFTPGQERFSVRGQLRQRFAENIDLTASLSYSPSETVTNRSYWNLRYLDVPADNPYNPFGQPVRVRRTAAGLPTRTVIGSPKRWRFSSEIKGEFREWDWSAQTNVVREISETLTINELPERYDSRCRCYLSPVHDAVVDGTLNVFGESLQGSNTQELLDSFVVPTQTFDSSNKDTSLEAFLRRSLELLPAGAGRFVIGASHRIEGLEYKRVADPRTRVYLVRPEAGFGDFPDNTAEAGNPEDLRESFAAQLEDTHGVVYSEPNNGVLFKNRAYSSVFAELHTPILADGFLVKQVSMNAAVRHEKADDYGSNRTWSLGGVWQVNNKLTFRARRGTSYSVPRISKSSVPTEIRPVPFFIDFSGTISTSLFLFGTTAIYGGNSALTPENAETFCFGADYKDFLADNLDVRFNYSWADYQNTIDSLRPFALTGLLPFFTSEYVTRWPGIYRFDRNPCDDPDYKGHLTTLDGECYGTYLGTDARAFNIGDLESANADLFLDYSLETAMGRFVFKWNVTHPLEMVRKDGPEEIALDIIDLGNISKFRQTGSITWNSGRMRVSLNLSHSHRTSSEFNNLGGDYDGIESIERTVYNYPVVANLIARYRMGRSFGMGLDSLEFVFGTNNIGGKYTTSEEWVTAGCAAENTSGGCHRWFWEPAQTELEGFLPSLWSPNRGRSFYVELNAIF